VNLFCEHSEPYSETWPNSGTTRNGVAYEQPTSVLHTVAIESSSLLSTPQSRDYKGRPADGFNTACLVRDIEDLLPTPRAQNGEARNQMIWPRDPTQPQNLENALALLPTPNSARAANDMDLTCSGDGRATPNKLGWALSELAQTLPNAEEALLHGVSTDPQSSGGNGPSAA